MLVIAGLAHTTLLLTTILVQRKVTQRLHVKCQLFCAMLFIVSEKRLSKWNSHCHTYRAPQEGFWLCLLLPKGRQKYQDAKFVCVGEWAKSSSTVPDP